MKMLKNTLSELQRPVTCDIRSKGERSRLQSHKVQKGDRVAGVSYALYRVASL